GKPGNDRGLAIAGIGAHDQDRARGARPLPRARAVELEGGVQSPQRLAEQLGWSQLALSLDDRRSHAGEGGEDLHLEAALEGSVDIAQRTQAAIEPADDVDGQGREE